MLEYKDLAEKEAIASKRFSGKSLSGKTLGFQSFTCGMWVIRMIIKFFCAVADIDQLILMLSILQMWNLERNIWEFEAESILIITSCSLERIEKERVDSRLYALKETDRRRRISPRNPLHYF